MCLCHNESTMCMRIQYNTVRLNVCLCPSVSPRELCVIDRQTDRQTHTHTHTQSYNNECRVLEYCRWNSVCTSASCSEGWRCVLMRGIDACVIL